MKSQVNRRDTLTNEIALFVSIQAFETYWAYYSMSSGSLYIEQTKEAANNLLNSYEALLGLDKGVLNWKKRLKGDAQIIENILQSLREWSSGKSELSLQPLIQHKAMLFFLFSELKIYLSNRLGLKSLPPIALSIEEFRHTERYLRWQPHLPSASIGWEYDKTFDISKISESQTIAVYGDIRRSQDLMTYTVNPNRFEEMIIKFLESIRSLLDKNLGIFDKFTGDGFVGYFNEYLCYTQSQNFLDCFINFSKQCMESCYPLFDEWKKEVRKLPKEDVMLSLGADIGKIHFGDQHGHLVCIGDAIVWAQRMCAAAPAGRIYVNNILANILKEKEGIQLSSIPSKTKTGESFLASQIQFI